MDAPRGSTYDVTPLAWAALRLTQAARRVLLGFVFAAARDTAGRTARGDLVDPVLFPVPEGVRECAGGGGAREGAPVDEPALFWSTFLAGCHGSGVGIQSRFPSAPGLLPDVAAVARCAPMVLRELAVSSSTTAGGVLDTRCAPPPTSFPPSLH